jgi:SAM-dependent methyltransferase
VPSAASTTPPACGVCGRQTTERVSPWTFHCPHCGLWQSTLEHSIEAQDHGLDEEHRVAALQDIRRDNFARIFEHLARLMPAGRRRLLDVGCAYGWFLSAAAEQGIDAIGIEPDAYTAAAARARGLDVIAGYFPDSLPANRTFDAVAFNDVLEHIPGVHRMLAACTAVLEPGGLLVLSVPTSDGTLFRIARALARIGVVGPWERLWQKPFPSPHQYYFNQRVLDLAAARHGFTPVVAEGSTTIKLQGLWSRMRFDRRRPVLASVILYLGVLLLYPAYVLVAHADTELLIYRHDGPAR